MTKYIICDIYNTLLDSRNRKYSNLYFFSLIHQDTVNYPVLQSLKSMANAGYRLVFFAYSNVRYESVVHELLQAKGFKPCQYQLYVDSVDRSVVDCMSLKSHIYETQLKDLDIIYAVDADNHAIDFWKSKDVLIMSPQYA